MEPDMNTTVRVVPAAPPPFVVSAGGGDPSGS
jgi:hypothetical protein